MGIKTRYTVQELCQLWALTPEEVAQLAADLDMPVFLPAAFDKRGDYLHFHDGVDRATGRLGTRLLDAVGEGEDQHGVARALSGGQLAWKWAPIRDEFYACHIRAPAVRAVEKQRSDLAKRANALESTRENNTLLKMVLGMARAKYDYKSSVDRQACTGDKAGSIPSDTEVTPATVRKLLAKAEES
ncbi:hypothetical protein [Solimonas sp. SE-A11]|uniref:hypothetical protein n=1 Tax=Solimonas sp. SE-A11 TaxID=3054954 RepID=UPI00259C826A|nr:hypothetical protein [Solimonas sp. SE-A11]MDM4770849.1 hypothetical protein [Solimonas sp. SE-A11]